MKDDTVYIPMPDSYIQHFVQCLVDHHSEHLRLALNCTKAVAQSLTVQQIYSLTVPDKVNQSNRIAIKRVADNQLIGGIWYTAQAEQLAIIHWLWIEENYRGRGEGRRLLRYVIEQCKKINSLGMVLHVFGANKEGEALYKSVGFEDVGKEMYLKW